MTAHKRLRLLLVCALSVGMLAASSPAHALDTTKLVDSLVNPSGPNGQGLLEALGLNVVPEPAA